jgi:hypothetical protein
MVNEQSNTQYFEQLSEKLLLLYCINFDDTGYTECEWLERFGDLALDEAIDIYAEKYDLTAYNKQIAHSSQTLK